MTIWRMHIACWIPEATNSHTGCVILIVFHCNSGCMNVPQCCILCTLLALFSTRVNIFETNREILSGVGLGGGAEFYGHLDLHCKFNAFIHAVILNYLMRLHYHVSKRLPLHHILIHLNLF